MEARRELTEAVRQRHLSAGRTEKRRILDEFAEMAGYHRKYAIRVLGNGHRKESSSQQPERRIYNEAVITALTILWEAADRICGKRLKAVLPTFVESMEHHGHLCLDVEGHCQLGACASKRVVVSATFSVGLAVQAGHIVPGYKSDFPHGSIANS